MSTRDPEASFAKKGGETCHGCKGHIAADRSGTVTDYRFGDAAPHDSNFIDELTRDHKKIVVDDSDCRGRGREATPEARGVACAIAFRRRRGRKNLPPTPRRLNRLIDRVRAMVEHPFAWMRNMGYRRVRHRGRRRNEPVFALMLMACNRKRGMRPTAARTG
jgi:IS5 family transposase